jgi:hypothetical protein
LLSENTRFPKAEIIGSLLFKEERMKRFWLVLLSLGLVMAFSVSALAVDVKVSAEYYAAGMYLNKTSVNDGWYGGNEPNDNPSTAFFYQRLRVGTDFVVSPCLKLVTRFTAMERVWGGARSSGYGGYPPNVITENTNGTAGTRAEAENIAFDLVYIDYTSPIGMFRVGYQPDYVWGTVFGDRANGKPAGQIMYAAKKGAFTFIFDYAKEQDNSYSAVNYSSASAYKTDRDSDSWRVAGIYEFKGGEAGALFLYNRDASHRGWAMTETFPLDVHVPYKQNVFAIDPFVKAKIGPVTLQAEAQYWFGDAAKFEYGGLGYTDIKVDALSVFVDATANFGMFNVGGSFAYLSGDDPNSHDKIEGQLNTAGLDWNPCLIMFNTELNYWAGEITGHTGSAVNREMANAWFGQLRFGVKPTPQWDIQLAMAYAQADKKPANPYHIGGDIYPNGTYGTEVDLTATYKITNNLSYMLGAGYLFTGDIFKGRDIAGEDYKISDDFTLINKLTLSF